MNTPANSKPTGLNFQALMDYIQDEVTQADSPERINDIISLIIATLSQARTLNTVTGLEHIRAEISPQMHARQRHAHKATQDIDPTVPAPRHNVTTTVPDALVPAFYDLSKRMNDLQSRDPETFVNASKALHWLARNETCVN